MKNSIFLPKSIFGKNLPCDMTKKAKKIRIKYYIIESIFFGVLISVIDIVVLIIKKLIDTITIFKSNILNVIFTCLTTFILSFLISYIFNYVLSERKIKKYHNLIQ